MSETMSAPTSSSDSGSVSESSAPAESNENQSQSTQSESAEKKAAPADVPAPSTKKKIKYQVDGEDIEEEIDFADEETLTKRMRMSRAAEKRFSEAQSMKAKALGLIKAIENGDESFFEQMGPKGREAAEKFLLKKIQEEMLTPEERERRDRDAELEKYRTEKRQSEEQKQKAALEAKSFKFAQEFQNTIIGALEKSGLPKSPEAVKRMAGLLKKNLDLGLDLTAAELASEYKNEVVSIIKSLASSADGDTLISLLGEDTANKIRKSDLKKLQEKHGQVFSSNQKSSSTPMPEPEKGYLTMDEWKEQLNQRWK